MLTAGILLPGCAASAADPDAARPARGFRLAYRLSGGIAGFDVTFTVDEQGMARYRRTRPEAELKSAQLGAEELLVLARVVRESGFLELGSRYEPTQAVADAFRYEIRWAEPSRSKVVVAADGVELPPAFVAVREAVAALERRVLAAGPQPPVPPDSR